METLSSNLLDEILLCSHYKDLKIRFASDPKKGKLIQFCRGRSPEEEGGVICSLSIQNRNQGLCVVREFLESLRSPAKGEIEDKRSSLPILLGVNGNGCDLIPDQVINNIIDDLKEKGQALKHQLVVVH